MIGTGTVVTVVETTFVTTILRVEAIHTAETAAGIPAMMVREITIDRTTMVILTDPWMIEGTIDETNIGDVTCRLHLHRQRCLAATAPLRAVTYTATVTTTTTMTDGLLGGNVTGGLDMAPASAHPTHCLHSHYLRLPRALKEKLRAQQLPPITFVLISPRRGLSTPTTPNVIQWQRSQS
eukprot:m.450144 g.450144  ORF g.450144 m.450144 type:complete len:180 (+) comp19931_c0_seq1:1420-1959(+)